MFKRILFPTDFSAHAEKTMECLGALKGAGVEEVVLVHVADVRPLTDWLDLEGFEKWRQEATDQLQEAAGRLEAEGLSVKRLLKTGPPFLGIVEAVKEEGVSLIVIGSHGKGYVKEVLLGSTTENVLRHSPVPVLVEKFKTVEVAGKAACEFMSQRLFTKVLYPTDFSQPARRVQDYITHLKAAGAEEVVVLHVQDVGRLRPHLSERMAEFNRIDTGRLEVIKAEIEAAGLKVKTVLREGVPFQEILKVADEEGVSLIAMSYIGRGMVKEALMGSVSGKVVRMAAQPVLLVG
jgi:nucleotide-binding universal stress UspA family protein